MKRRMLVLLPLLATVLAWGQTPPPGTISHPPSWSTTNYANPEMAGYPAQGNLSFTNRAGQTYTVGQLTAQLQMLRQAVDQTLPLVTAFNENVSNSIPGGRETITGAISDILRGLNRNQSGGTAANPVSTNQLILALQGMLNTNAPGTGVTNANTLQDLTRLQSDLQPVGSVLQDLHVSGAVPNPDMAAPQAPYRGLTPTGR